MWNIFVLYSVFYIAVVRLNDSTSVIQDVEENGFNKEYDMARAALAEYLEAKNRFMAFYNKSLAKEREKKSCLFRIQETEDKLIVIMNKINIAIEEGMNKDTVNQLKEESERERQQLNVLEVLLKHLTDQCNHARLEMEIANSDYYDAEDKLLKQEMVLLEIESKKSDLFVNISYENLIAVIKEIRALELEISKQEAIVVDLNNIEMENRKQGNSGLNNNIVIERDIISIVLGELKNKMKVLLPDYVESVNMLTTWVGERDRIRKCVILANYTSTLSREMIFLWKKQFKEAEGEKNLLQDIGILDSAVQLSTLRSELASRINSLLTSYDQQPISDGLIETEIRSASESLERNKRAFNSSFDLYQSSMVRRREFKEMYEYTRAGFLEVYAVYEPCRMHDEWYMGTTRNDPVT